MPMYLKRDAIRFIEASVSAISMAVAALGMPRRYDFREVAAENAVAIGLAGVAAELSMSAVIVQAQGEDALKFPTGFYKTGSHIVDDFKKLVGSQIPKMMFLTQGIEEPSAHIAKLLEMASKLKLLTKLRAGGLHAGRGPSMDVSIACVNDVIAFISLLGASSRIALNHCLVRGSLKTVSIQQVKTVCMELILLILALTKTKTFSSLNAKTLLMELLKT